MQEVAVKCLTIFIFPDFLLNIPALRSPTVRKIPRLQCLYTPKRQKMRALDQSE